MKEADTKGNILYDPTYIKYPEKQKYPETESKLMVASEQKGEGNVKWLLNEYGYFMLE